MRELLAMAGKDLRLLLRDKAGLFFTFFFPILMAVFFGSIFSGGGGGAGGIRIALVDEDGTAESAAFVETLREAAELEVETASREEALDAVRRSRRTAFVVVSEGFGRSNPMAGSPPRVELGVDPARRAEAGMLQGVLTRYAAQRLSVQLMGPAGSAFTPLKIDESKVAVQRIGPANAYEISFPQGVIWAVLGCTAAFGISLIVERSRGTLVRLQMAPIGRATILGGKALACFATNLVLAAVLLGLGRVVFGVRLTSPGKLALAVLATSACFVGIMMLLAVLGRTEQSAGIGWAVLLVLAMTGGGMIPLFAMPEWMQKVSHMSPVKWAILSLEGAIWRGFSYGELLLPCAILAAVGVIAFAAGTRAFRWLG